MSTALMYSFAQRKDMRVLDEPLYGYFLERTGAERPCREATLAERPSTATSVLEFMRPRPEEWNSEEHLFCKHMANHAEGLPWSSFEGHRHVILFRNPASVMDSYGAHIQRPTMQDLGYQDQCNLLERMDEHGRPPVVVCSDRLQAHPKKVLQNLCNELGLSWSEDMMTWGAGARPEDGPWAPWWYTGVHASAGWEARKPSEHSVPAHLKELHGSCLDAYHALLERSI